MAIDIELDQVHRYTLEQYHQLIESGGLDEHPRVELIDGLVLRMSSKTPEHEKVIVWLSKRLMLGVDLDRFDVTVGGPITTGRSEPEPDLAVIPCDVERPYHPATAALVVEVAWSSRRRDLVHKPPIYAAAGIPDYWVVDLEEHTVVVHRDPSPSGYGAVTEQDSGMLRPVAAGLPAVDAGELLRAAFL